MLGILKFNLPEERIEFEQACDAGHYVCVIEELDNFLRSKLKYGGDTLTEEQYHVYETIREKLRELRDDK